MSESLRREARPLLRDSSDEDTEVKSGRRWRSGGTAGAGSRGRAVSKMRGAATLINQWPDQISSLVYNCWVMLFFVVILLVVAYSVMMTLSVLPSNRFRSVRGLLNLQTKSKVSKETPKSAVINVFCPIIINVKEKFNLSNHASSLKHLKQRFPQYRYNLLLLVNDTNTNIPKDNNVIAMNDIVNQDSISKEIERYFNYNDEGLVVEKHILSIFMDNSPLKNEWRSLSTLLIPFLVKTITIWESVGITFNLNAFIEKNNEQLKQQIENILTDYSQEIRMTAPSTHNIPIVKSVLNVNVIKPSKPINNIRDVIENLKNDELRISVAQPSLMAEESKLSETIANRAKRSLSVLSMLNETKYLFHKPRNENNKSENNLPKFVYTNISSDMHPFNDSHTLNYKDSFFNSTIMKYKGLLPQFLKMLFNTDDNFNARENDQNLNSSNIHDLNIIPSVSSTQKRESLSPRENFTDRINADIITFGKPYKYEIDNETNINKGNIARVKSLENLSVTGVDINDTTTKSHSASGETIPLNEDGNINLILHMKGELMATKAYCHAFIGQIFSTIRKYPTIRSVSKLIDKTLKIFCHDNIYSNCSGIKLLL